jgi:hypothetical protein
MAARHGKSANIFQHADVMGLQYRREIGEIARGMPNGKDGGHLLILFDERKKPPLRHGGTEKTLER